MVGDTKMNNQTEIENRPLGTLAERVELLIVESEYYSVYIAAALWVMGGKKAHIVVLNRDNPEQSLQEQCKALKPNIPGLFDRALIIGFGNWPEAQVDLLLDAVSSFEIDIQSTFMVVTDDLWSRKLASKFPAFFNKWWFFKPYVQTSGDSSRNPLLLELQALVDLNHDIQGRESAEVILSMAIEEEPKIGDPTTFYLTTGRGSQFRGFVRERILDLAHERESKGEGLIKFVTVAEYLYRAERVSPHCALVAAKRPLVPWPCATLGVAHVEGVLKAYNIRALIVLGVSRLGISRTECIIAKNRKEWYELFHGYQNRKTVCNQFVFDTKTLRVIDISAFAKSILSLLGPVASSQDEVITFSFTDMETSQRHALQAVSAIEAHFVL